MERDLPLVGIGIDSVSWARMKRFIKEHSFSYLKRLLTPSEQNQFLKNSNPLPFFARCFAAKEAYFKALGGAWMGEAGFREIEVSLKGKKRFRIGGKFRSDGIFFQTQNGVGARVLVWQLR